MGKARKLRVVDVPSIKEPITKSPGFAKKELADYKLDLMALCGFGCSYCSSNSGNYLRIRREDFADLTEQQLGERLYPATSPELTFRWPDVLDRLRAQLRIKSYGWGKGHTLVVSQLTDAFSGPAFTSGDTREALDLVLECTSFRVRILTKNSVVGLSPSWVDYFRKWRDRVVVGLSIGTLDDEWAARVEIGTPPPSARVRALRALQDAGVPTYGMLCPIFPDALEHLNELLSSVRPGECETVWAEPYNDRTNWASVRAGYAHDSDAWRWFTNTYENGDRRLWSDYAAKLYEGLHYRARRDGWLHKLRYLLYETDILADDATRFRNFDSILLQSPKREDGTSRNAAIRALQVSE